MLRLVTLGVVLAMTASVESGCAILTQQHLPDQWTAGQEANCEVSHRWIVDAVGAGVMLAAGIAGAVAATQPNPSDKAVAGGAVAGGIGGIGGVVFVTSAITGASWNRRCEYAREHQSTP